MILVRKPYFSPKNEIGWEVEFLCEHLFLLVYKTKTGSGTIDVSGGKGGKGCTADNGDVGKDGADGKPGHVKEIQLIY